jgi:hypothetical protein
MPDDNAPWSPPDTLTIPIPLELSRKRGMFAKKSEDFPASVRLTPADKVLIETEARHLGLTFSVFSRWCIVQCARQLALSRTGELPKVDL